MNKIVTLNALRGNSYSLFRKIPLMINMGVCHGGMRILFGTGHGFRREHA